MKLPTDLPERNVELLRATMDFIERHPEKHEQAQWATQCGTAFCYAGHAALLAGATPPGANTLAFGRFWTIDPDTFQSRSETTLEQIASGTLLVDEFAARQLGITVSEMEVMFAGDRTREQLRMLVDALCDGAWIDDDEWIHFTEETSCYVDDWFDVGDDD